MECDDERVSSSTKETPFNSSRGSDTSVETIFLVGVISVVSGEAEGRLPDSPALVMDNFL